MSGGHSHGIPAGGNERPLWIALILTVPEGIDLGKVRTAILGVPGVAAVHDLHVWSISSGKPSLTIHVVCGQSTGQWPAISQSMRALVAERFHIYHMTIQLEDRACEQDTETHKFAPDPVLHDEHKPHLH